MKATFNRFGADHTPTLVLLGENEAEWLLLERVRLAEASGEIVSKTEWNGARTFTLRFRSEERDR